MNNLMRYILGWVEFEIIGGRGERFLNFCAKSNIPITNIVAMDLGYTAKVPLRYYLRLRQIARKHRCKLRVKHKHGMFFSLYKYRKRFGIAIGGFLVCVLLWVCPRMVWSIQFYDFTYQEQAILRKQLYDYGLAEGSMPTKQDLISIQQSLFVDNTEYSWVQLNFIYGKIIVEKVNATLPPEMEEEEPAAIVALCDGIIESVEVDGGFIEKSAGQSVAKGDVIVSALKVGRRDKLHTQRASAKVYATVERTYEVTQSYEVTYTAQDVGKIEVYGLEMLGKSITFPFGVSKNENLLEYTKTVMRWPLNLFGLPLPATVVCTQYRKNFETTAVISKEEALNLAQSRVYDAITLDLPECEIQSVEHSVQENEESLTLQMKIVAKANIAQLVEGWNL